MESTESIEPPRKMVKIEYNTVQNEEQYLKLFDHSIYTEENYENGRRWHNLLKFYHQVIYENNLGEEYEELINVLSNIVQDYYCRPNLFNYRAKDLINKEIQTFYKTHNDLFDRQYIRELINLNIKFTLDMLNSTYKEAYYVLRSEFIEIFIKKYSHFINLTDEEKIKLKEFSHFYFPEGFYSYIMLE